MLMNNIGECPSLKECQRFCHLKVCTFHSRRFPTYIKWCAGTHFRAERLWPQGWLSAVDRREGRDGALCLACQRQHSVTCANLCNQQVLFGLLAALGRALDGWNSSSRVSPTLWSRIVTWCYAVFTWQGRRGNPNHDCCLDIAQGLIGFLALKMYQRGSYIEAEYYAVTPGIMPKTRR